MTNELLIAIVVGSTRPHRKARVVAEWVHGFTIRRTNARYELLDIADFNLPLLDEPLPPSLGRYSLPHTKAWAAAVAKYDGYVFVTPEFNHSTSGALKNAIDFLFAEWHNKACGFVGYGSSNGVRAVEHLRQIVAEVMMADVRVAVGLSLFDDFEQFTIFKPRDLHEKIVDMMLGQVESWAGALRPLRNASKTPTA
jgi:NAD(P)H-dependent FMN reductase